MEPLSEQERKEVIHRDRFHTPLQPLKYNLEAHSYEGIERDTVKYIQYRRAIARALEDRVPNEKASELTTDLVTTRGWEGIVTIISQ
ncbi:unnamed protein product [Arabidopsis lyrata]|nr:unnamed protein product [Arabidopsis lyrata]